MFKKILSLGVVLVVGLCVLCGCGGKKQTGTFYTLEDAYEQGLLTKEDLEQIATYNNDGTKFPETLDSEMELTIKKDAAIRMRNRSDDPVYEATAEGFEVIKFFGIYSDCYVVVMRNRYDLFPTDVPMRWVEICGVQFYLVGYYPIEVWKAD